MSYDVVRSDGVTVLATVVDNTTDTSSSSIALVGENVLGYGKNIAENFVHILENFAYSTAPSNPLEGQLWYDTSTSLLKVYNGSSFVGIDTDAQDLWETVAGDSGSIVATSATDTLTIAGGTGISTNASGTTVTITNTSPNVTQDVYGTIVADSGSDSAVGDNDTLTVSGGPAITTNITGNILTISTTALSNMVEDTSPQLGGDLDINGFAIGDGTNDLLSFVEDGAAVNNVEIENESTGAGPYIRAVGADTNVDLNLESKNEGNITANRLVVPNGTSANRPTNPTVGQHYFDTDVGLPIWFDGTHWIDATGVAV